MLSNISTNSTDVFPASRSINDVLDQISQNFILYLPLVFGILGLIGFLGNVFTYLQLELRGNTCCIYTFCGSIVDMLNLAVNLFPNYLATKHGIIIPWLASSILCKANLFLLVFLPHLAINCLLVAMIDRYACTSSLTSPLRRLNQLKMAPWMLLLAVVTSFVSSIYAPMIFDLTASMSCASTNPTATSILYVSLIGLLQPILMGLFIFLTYRNIRRSRQRVVSCFELWRKHFFSFSLGCRCSEQYSSSSTAIDCHGHCPNRPYGYLFSPMDHHVHIFCDHHQRPEKCRTECANLFLSESDQ